MKHLLALILSMALISCASTVPFAGPTTLTIKQCSVKGHKSLVRFQEIGGQWIIPTDTLAVGKTITVDFSMRKIAGGGNEPGDTVYQ